MMWDTEEVDTPAYNLVKEQGKTGPKWTVRMTGRCITMVKGFWNWKQSKSGVYHMWAGYDHLDILRWVNDCHTTWVDSEEQAQQMLDSLKNETRQVKVYYEEYC